VKIVGAIWSGLVYVCAATVLAEVVILGWLWSQGSLDSAAIRRVVALAVGREAPAQGTTDSAATERPRSAEQASLREQALALAEQSPYLKLRRQAVAGEGTSLQRRLADLQEDRRRYQLLISGFRQKLDQLETEARQNSMIELQRTLEAIHPKQAKDQLVQMLTDGAHDAVVKIVGNMTLEKRRKVLTEFKTPEEATLLNDILEEIRTAGRDPGQDQETR